MQDQQSLANQMGWMITTRDYLMELSNGLKTVKAEHQTILSNLKSVKYVNEGYTQVVSMTGDVDNKIDWMIKRINDEHLEYLDKQSKNILSALETFKN